MRSGSGRITGLGRRAVRHAYGIDPVQALQFVQQAIWRDLKPYERQLTWLGEPGWTGFYPYYSIYLGRAHTRRVEAAIDREIANESRRLKQRAAKKRQAANAKRGSRRAAA